MPICRQSKKEAEDASSLEKKEAAMLKKTMEISAQEAAALEAERKAMDEVKYAVYYRKEISIL